MLRLVLLLFCVCAWLAAGGPTSLSAATESAGERCDHLTGTFLQPLQQHTTWTSSDWDALMQDLAAVGVTDLFLQWTRLDDFVVFPDPEIRKVEPSLLNYILEAAQAHGIEVWLGLVYSPSYWERVQRAPEQLRVYLKRHRAEATDLARRLQEGVGRHPAIAGWYVTEEVDDVNWWARGKRQIFRDHLRDLAAELREVAPGRPVAISGFTSVTLDPAAYAGLWRGLIEASGVDLVLFQDGAGVGSLSPPEIGTYLEVLAPSVRDAGAEFGAIVELFTQRAGPPLDKEPFAADPGDLSRIREQIAVAATHTDRLVGFSMPDYMSAGGGPAATRLYRDYRNWLASQPECNGPGVPLAPSGG